MTIVTFGAHSFDTDKLKGRGFLTPYQIDGVTYEYETALRVAAALEMVARVQATDQSIATTAQNAGAAAGSATIATNKATEAQGYAASAGTHATTALNAAGAAQASAAGVNLPAITAADAGKGLEVKPDGSGWQLATYLKSLAGIASSWIRTVAGSAATPGLQVGEAGTGLYLVSTGVLALVTGTIEVFRTTASGVLALAKAVTGKYVALTWSSTITVDLTQGNIFGVTLAGVTIFANPSLTSAMVGMEFQVVAKQDGTGGRTIGLGSYFKFPGVTPTWSTAAGKTDRLICNVASTTEIHIVGVVGF